MKKEIILLISIIITFSLFGIIVKSEYTFKFIGGIILYYLLLKMTGARIAFSQKRNKKRKKVLMSNILKYTLGLPFMIGFTIIAPIIWAIFLMIYGDGGSLFKEIQKVWKPNE